MMWSVQQCYAFYLIYIHILILVYKYCGHVMPPQCTPSPLQETNLNWKQIGIITHNCSSASTLICNHESEVSDFGFNCIQIKLLIHNLSCTELKYSKQYKRLPTTAYGRICNLLNWNIYIVNGFLNAFCISVIIRIEWQNWLAYQMDSSTLSFKCSNVHLVY